MSSNIEIQRICEHCGNEFTARTTVTKICSPKCRKANYKLRERNKKIEESNKKTKTIKNKPLIDLKEKEFLTVREASILLGCSISTVHRLIENNVIYGVNLSERLTRIKRSELNKILEQPITKMKTYSINECSSLSEIQLKYNLSSGALYNIIQRNNIPKIQNGKFVFVPNELIDKILS